MDTATIYACYDAYVENFEADRPTGLDSPCESKSSRTTWGERLSFEQFQQQWEQIARTPVHRRYWEQRLIAGYENQVQVARRFVEKTLKALQSRESGRRQGLGKAAA